MEGFYVIFDRAQRRVGFAVSPCAGKRNIVQDLVSEWGNTCSLRETPLPLTWWGKAWLLMKCDGYIFEQSQAIQITRGGKRKLYCTQQSLAWSKSASPLGILAAFFLWEEIFFLRHLSGCAVSPTVTWDESLFLMQLHFYVVSVLNEFFN